MNSQTKPAPAAPPARTPEPAPDRVPPAAPSGASRTRKDRREDSMRSEALGLAVQFATGPNTFGNAEGVVNTADMFYKFLAGDVEAGK